MKENDFKVCLFFAPLQTKDVTSRKHFLEELENEFDVDDLFLDQQQRNGHHNDNSNSNDGSNGDIDHSSKYPILLRLAHECPFSDVRSSCGNILTRLENGGVRIPKRKCVGPSKFISAKDCISISTTDNEIQSLFVEAYLHNGRTSHINQLLGYHVRYLECFLEFESLLMKSNGPLHVDWRYYIGIMGAARHHCDILIEECEYMFLMMNGDPKWLQGLEYTPVKLQKLNRLNKILAHQPWLFSEDIIKGLLTGPPEETWTMSELIHAIIILVHFQTLSGFVFGCGITPEIDSRKGHTRRSPSSGEYSSGGEPLTPTKLRTNSFDPKTPEETGTTAGLLEKIQKVELEKNDSQDEKEDDKLRQFREVETKELDDNDAEMTDNTKYTSMFQGYVDKETFQYEEFAKRKQQDIEVFRAQDYSWQEHCFAFINRLLPEMGTLLDEKFDCTFNLTYNTIGDSITNVDTSKFRLATWNYIHLVYGIFHDDYVYYEVNKLLEKTYKSYIKKVACFPERITFVDYWDYYTDMLPSEKVHINLLVLESRFQAILLYASRGIMKYMNQC